MSGEQRQREQSSRQQGAGQQGAGQQGAGYQEQRPPNQAPGTQQQGAQPQGTQQQGAQTPEERRTEKKAAHQSSFDDDFAALSADALSFLDAYAETAEAEEREMRAAKTPPPENHTDFGNARRLVRLHGADIRYCHPWRDWLIWDDRRWKIDDSGAIMRKAKETVMSIYAEASRAEYEGERKEIVKWALRSESAARMKAMIELAESEPGIPVSPDELDQDDWLLNTLSGVINLRTGELLPHRREYMMTKIAPVHYDPDAKCPTWLAFLDRIMEGNEALISFLQRAVGYALTGNTREQVLFLFYGTGENGKSTFLETIEAMLGDYARQTGFDTFILKQNESVRNDLARLAGVRFVSAIEVERGKRLSESVVKQVTGQDTITARFLFKEYFEYKPKMKIFLACNHKPIIRGNDHAIWRRIRLIPFRVTITKKEKEENPDFDMKLRAELPGILAWAVQGCLEWQQQGLGQPVDVVEATQQYRDEMDEMKDFFDTRCVMGAEMKAFASDLYKEYLDWAQSAGIRKPMSQCSFGLKLGERGLTSGRGMGGRKIWKGIGLRSEEEKLTCELYTSDEYCGSKWEHYNENDRSFDNDLHSQEMEGIEDDDWEGSI